MVTASGHPQAEWQRQAGVSLQTPVRKPRRTFQTIIRYEVKYIYSSSWNAQLTLLQLPNTSEGKGHETSTESSGTTSKEVKLKKTMEQIDEELRLKLEGISGEGGNAGVEYEGGKAVGLKRGVKENMFRVI